ncbi:hypothetical protein FRB95_013509 [Tulasnella sp. JGI-2019a]|nr:hypothetical protein FRB95_013509 [Tulasnella sp. JGI-2019a]
MPDPLPLPLPLSHNDPIMNGNPSLPVANTSNSWERPIMDAGSIGSLERNRLGECNTETLLATGQPASISTRLKHLRRPPPKSIFNCLPLELLVKIIWLGARCNVCDYIPRLHTLAQVCKSWANVIKATPTLWYIASSHRPLFEWKAALKLSGSCPIVLLRRDSPENVLDEFWSAALQHTHRFTVLQVIGDDGEGVGSLKHATAPFLKSLHIEIRRQAPGAPVLAGAMNGNVAAAMPDPALITDLFKGGTPQLLHVELRNIALENWNSTLLSGLRTLEIKDVGSHGPSLQQLFNALSMCPDLEQLVLHDIAITDHTFLPLAVRHPILQLHRLVRISLVGFPTAMIAQIMSTVHMPRCTDIHVRGFRPEVPGASTEVLSALTASITPSLTTSLAAGGAAITLSLSTDPYLSVTLAHQPDHLIVFEDIASLADYLDWAEQLLAVHSQRSTTRIEEVCLDIQDGPRQGGLIDQLVTFLGRLPSVESLRVFGGELDGLWEAMSVAKLGSECGWLCPNLRACYLEDYYRPSDPEPFMRMVERRERAAALRKTMGREKDGPQALERLEIGSESEMMTVDVFRRIKAVLGDAVAWEGQRADFEKQPGDESAGILNGTDGEDSRRCEQGAM